MGYKVAVVGATGNVGREMLNILAERQFPADEVHALASRKSIGVEVSYGDEVLKCKDLETFDFSKVDFASCRQAPPSPRNGRRRSGPRVASSSITRASGAMIRRCPSSFRK